MIPAHDSGAFKVVWPHCSGDCSEAGEHREAHGDANTPPLTVTQGKKKRVLEPHIPLKATFTVTRILFQAHPMKAPPTSKHQHSEDRSLKSLGRNLSNKTITSGVNLSPEARGYQRPALLGAYRGERGLNPMTS